MRLPLLLAAVLCCLYLSAGAAVAQTAVAAPATPQPAPAATPAADDLFEEFLDDSVRSPLFYVQAFAGGVLDELGHFPDEWTGASGFGKRVAARTGQAFAAEAIGHAAAAVLHHRVRYDACTCTGPMARMGHALGRAFVSVRRDGGRAPNWSLWTSKYASAGLANAWFPGSYTKGDMLWQGTTALGTSAGLNVVREFSPELLRLVHLR